MIEIVPSILPIFLLIGMGFYMRKKEIIQESTVDEIQNIVLYVGLPALIFLSFKDMELQREHLTLTLIVFLFYCVVFLIGLAVNKIKRFSSPMLPFLIPCCALATLGIPLYVSVFGVENLPKYAILSVGHELFLWFVLMLVLQAQHSKTAFSTKMIKDFIKNPFILAVLFGIIFNVTGFNHVWGGNVIYQGIEKFLDHLGTFVTPLILIVIGYGLKLNKKYTGESIKILMVRIPLLLIVGYLVKMLFLDKMLIEDRFFDYAWFTFLILPPPYAMPLLIGKHSTEENTAIATNTIVLGTIVTIIIFVIFAFSLSL